MKQIKFKLTGVSPLMMHKDTLANPLDPRTKKHKQLTAKRKKTDEDLEAIAKSGWLAALYWDKETGPFIPGRAIEATMFNAAKLQKLGRHVQRGAMCLDDKAQIQFEGKNGQTPEQLYKDGQFTDLRPIPQRGVRILRCRPIFKNWSAECTIAYNEDVLDQREIEKIFQDAGSMIGILEERPRMGKFEAKRI